MAALQAPVRDWWEGVSRTDWSRVVEDEQVRLNQRTGKRITHLLQTMELARLLATETHAGH